MKGRINIGLEFVKLLFVLVTAGMAFLFFCLALDVFCFFLNSGWNPLLGDWPIFSGSLAAVFYGPTGSVVCLILCMIAIGRLVLWNRVPLILNFLVKHPA